MSDINANSHSQHDQIQLIYAISLTKKVSIYNQQSYVIQLQLTVSNHSIFIFFD